jgi:hypothetical protein
MLPGVALLTSSSRQEGFTEFPSGLTLIMPSCKILQLFSALFLEFHRCPSESLLSEAIVKHASSFPK